MRLVACLTLLIALAARGQELRFQQLTTADGLSDNAITCILEDREGYIWIGTERGLNRYDGQRVEQFPPGATGPTGASIASITEDEHGRLWIATHDAGLSMRATDGSFTHYRHDPADPRSLPTDALNHALPVDDSLVVISTGSHGAVWFHLRNGLLFERLYPREQEPKDGTPKAVTDWCHGVLRLDKDRLWLTMLRDGRCHIVDARTGVSLSASTPGWIVSNTLLHDGMLYMGGWTPGLFRARASDGTPEPPFRIEAEITAIVPWGPGRLLAATKVSGLLLVSTDGEVLQRYQHARRDPSSLLSDRTRCLFRDRSGNIWVGTEKGISLHAPSVWRMEAVPLLPEQHQGDLVFRAIQQDADGTVRISTSIGFLLVDPQRKTSRLISLEHGGIRLELTGLFEPAPGQWFVGTETGVFRYDKEREQLLRATAGSTWNHHRGGNMFQVRSMHASHGMEHESFVTGALGYGHVALDPATGERLAGWTDYTDQKGTMMLASTEQDARGDFWSATRGGVVRWRSVNPGEELDEAYYNTSAAEGRTLAADDAQGLAIRGDTVWVALRNAGLAMIVGGKCTNLMPPAHLPRDSRGVTVDAAGKAWCATGDGLVRYDPKNGAWLHVPVNDGRAFKQLTRCIITLHDGRIALCADDHLLLFDPRAFDGQAPLPVPAIVSLRNTWGMLNEASRGSLELPFRNSAFDAMLTALQPVGAEPLTFLYRLDSEGEGWHETDAQSPARYAGVPVGKHRLLVRVRDAYGREGPEHALLTIAVVGPFWQRWWFFLIVVLVGAAGMYLVSRLRQRQRLRLQHVRDRIARDLHDDIGSTLGSISFYSEALRRKLSSESDGMTQDVAERIGSSSREMIDRMSDIVWSVDPKHDDAGALIERLRAFATDLLAAKGVALEFNADEELSDRKLTAEQRRNLFLICKEALHNTVKYADAKHASIGVRQSGRGLRIELADDGRGFDPENAYSYNGNGLANMRARAASIGAELGIDSAPGRGTRISIALSQQPAPRSGD